MSSEKTANDVCIGGMILSGVQATLKPLLSTGRVSMSYGQRGIIVFTFSLLGRRGSSVFADWAAKRLDRTLGRGVDYL